MRFEKKDLPPPTFKRVFRPQDDDYKHFEHAADLPFDATSSEFSRLNAWWLADASLLSYWDRTVAQRRFLDDARLQSAAIDTGGTQCYVAWNDTFALVAFRGTEPDALRDILADARLRLRPWRHVDGGEVDGGKVHEGFQDALQAVWLQLVDALKKLNDRRVWFTGHSLGAALATLAGDRFFLERARHGFQEPGGMYTFGSPLVGDRAFVDGFNGRHRNRSFRFVNDRDSVTTAPPQQFGYRHVNDRRFVGFDDPDVNMLAEGLIDHAPRRYATLVWNAFVDGR